MTYLVVIRVPFRNNTMGAGFPYWVHWLYECVEGKTAEWMVLIGLFGEPQDGNTDLSGTVSPVRISDPALFTVSGVSRFNVPSSSSSPHRPHAEAGGSLGRSGRSAKLGRGWVVDIFIVNLSNR